MYGMPVKRFDYDFYRDNKRAKKLDFCGGFIGAAVLWAIFFKPVWYTALVVIFFLAMAGLWTKFERRYVLYGALALIFFPFLLWATLFAGWMGRKEINS
jgi:hypothetical protein